MSMQQEHDAKRADYMNRRISFQDFYLWLGDAIGVTDGMVPVTLGRLLESRDKHLNDIPLVMWDKRDAMVRYRAVQAGMRSWSLSDTVCVLKARARRMIEEAQR